LKKPARLLLLRAKKILSRIGKFITRKILLIQANEVFARLALI
jgi:hypothetical protein